jgi:hypothetical protein
MPGSAVFLYVHIGKPLRDTIIPVRRFVSGGGRKQTTVIVVQASVRRSVLEFRHDPH